MEHCRACPGSYAFCPDGRTDPAGAQAVFHPFPENRKTSFHAPANDEQEVLVSKKKKGFLVLSRQRGEIVMIGDAIEVHVVDIRGGNIRLGFRAPKGVPVHRLEVWEQIQRENRSAEA